MNTLRLKGCSESEWQESGQGRASRLSRVVSRLTRFVLCLALQSQSRRILRDTAYIDLNHNTYFFFFFFFPAAAKLSSPPPEATGVIGVPPVLVFPAPPPFLFFFVVLRGQADHSSSAFSVAPSSPPSPPSPSRPSSGESPTAVVGTVVFASASGAAVTSVSMVRCSLV